VVDFRSLLVLSDFGTFTRALERDHHAPRGDVAPARRSRATATARGRR
jgi:hypothetical protein